MVTTEKMVEIENVNCPGRTSNVNSLKYEAMKKALLKVVPKKQPGITQRQMFDAILPHLPQDMWPNGEKSGWWAKTVQLDLEAKNVLQRTNGKPLRWYRT